MSMMQNHKSKKYLISTPNNRHHSQNFIPVLFQRSQPENSFLKHFLDIVKQVHKKTLIQVDLCHNLMFATFAVGTKKCKPGGEGRRRVAAIPPSLWLSPLLLSEYWWPAPFCFFKKNRSGGHVKVLRCWPPRIWQLFHNFSKGATQIYMLCRKDSEPRRESHAAALI